MSWRDVDKIFEGDDDNDDDDIFGTSSQSSHTTATKPSLSSLTGVEQRTEDSIHAMFYHVLSSAHTSRNVPRHRGIYRAVFEWADEQSGGLVSLRSKVYEAEANIVSYHFELRVFHMALGVIREYDFSNCQPLVTLHSYLEAQMQILNFALNRTIAQYIGLCQEFGVAPDYTVIDQGIFTHVTPAVEALMGNPMGLSHHRYDTPPDIEPFQIYVFKTMYSLAVESILNQHSGKMEEIFS